MNTRRSESFIKVKHSIESCTDIRQLKSASNFMHLIPDHKEFTVLLHYYEAKQAELELDTPYFEEEILNIHHKKLESK